MKRCKRFEACDTQSGKYSSRKIGKWHWGTLQQDLIEFLEETAAINAAYPINHQTHWKEATT